MASVVSCVDIRLGLSLGRRYWDAMLSISILTRGLSHNVHERFRHVDQVRELDTVWSRFMLLQVEGNGMTRLGWQHIAVRRGSHVSKRWLSFGQKDSAECPLSSFARKYPWIQALGSRRRHVRQSIYQIEPLPRTRHLSNPIILFDRRNLSSITPNIRVTVIILT